MNGSNLKWIIFFFMSKKAILFNLENHVPSPAFFMSWSIFNESEGLAYWKLCMLILHFYYLSRDEYYADYRQMP